MKPEGAGGCPVGIGPAPEGAPEGGGPELYRIRMYHYNLVKTNKLTDEHRKAWEGEIRKAEREQEHPGDEHWQHQMEREGGLKEEGRWASHQMEDRTEVG